MTLDSFMTARWNNRFSLGLGLLFFSYSILAVITMALSVEQAFTGLVLIGCLF